MSQEVEKQLADKLATLLNSYLDAITALLVGGVVEYHLDTGQGKQRVTKLDVAQMQETWGLLFQQWDALNSRCNGGGAVTVVPYTW